MGFDMHCPLARILSSMATIEYLDLSTISCLLQQACHPKVRLSLGNCFLIDLKEKDMVPKGNICAPTHVEVGT